jgi:hypothetical protein
MDSVQTLTVESYAPPSETVESKPALTSNRYELDDASQAVEFFYQKGWTDGLPVVPPTPERVEEFLYYGGKFPDEVLGYIPARNRVITAEKVAINAVMAGCLPSYMPVIFAAFEAMLADEFNFHGPNASTAGSAPLMIVNGPVVQELNINGGANCFGPGVRANATIGRAVRLAMMNVAGSVPGVIDRSTFGHPGKYSFCIAENEAVNPWEPLSVERGIPEGTSAVTIFAAESPRQVISPAGGTPERLVLSIVNTMFGMLYRDGCWVLILSPEHTITFKNAGWSKNDIRKAIQERALRPLDEFKRLNGLPEELIKPGDETKMLSYLPSPEKMLIVTAGGDAGVFSMLVPPWAGTNESMPVTKPIGVCLDC